MSNKYVKHVRQPREHTFMVLTASLCCMLVACSGCALYEEVVEVVFSPDGRKLAYVCETGLAEIAVDGRRLLKTDTLYWCTVNGAIPSVPPLSKRLGTGSAEYPSNRIEIKWSPDGSRVGVLISPALMIVDANANETGLRDGTITSFAWLSDNEIAYCTRRAGGGVQRRVVCRQRLDGRQREDMVAFAEQPANRYSWREHWAPSGQVVILVEPALGGRYIVLNVIDGTIREVGQTGVRDCGVAWFTDSSCAFCVSERVGDSGVYEAILLEPATGRAIDCSTQFREAFGNRIPRLGALSTADNTYVLVNCVVGGGYLVQPEPWKVFPLGQALRPELARSEASTDCPSLFQLPVPGTVGVFPTGNEGDSPTKWAAACSGACVLPLLETRGSWAVSPDGRKVATADDDRHIRVVDVGEWWVSLAPAVRH